MTACKASWHCHFCSTPTLCCTLTAFNWAPPTAMGGGDVGDIVIISDWCLLCSLEQARLLPNRVAKQSSRRVSKKNHQVNEPRVGGREAGFHSTPYFVISCVTPSSTAKSVHPATERSHFQSPISLCLTRSQAAATCSLTSWSEWCFQHAVTKRQLCCGHFSIRALPKKKKRRKVVHHLRSCGPTATPAKSTAAPFASTKTPDAPAQCNEFRVVSC